MTPAEVIREVEVAGFAVWLDGETPRLKCPAGLRPNAALLAALTEHRAGIIELLTGVPAPMETCSVCKAMVRDGAGVLCDQGGNRTAPRCPYK